MILIRLNAHDSNLPRRRAMASGAFLLTIQIVCLLIAISSVQAQTYKVLHRFTAKGDGEYPWAGVIRDSKGDIYGTTYWGGSFYMGAVFKIDARGKESTFHSFWGGDGMDPQASLIKDNSGNLYGTTSEGGSPKGGKCQNHGCGAVFKLGPSGKSTVQYAFTGGTDGDEPQAALIRDRKGTLYGTTTYGGDSACENGCGLVFKVDKDGKETVLHSFTGGSDGAAPAEALIQDQTGNLYGITGSGGPSGWGTVFKLDTAGNESILYGFSGGTDGGGPSGPLIRDKDGNLYGVTDFGGNLSYCRQGEYNGCGVVFKLDTTGKETVLHAFTGGSDGAFPAGRLVRDDTGNLYGATSFGGSLTACYGGGCGTVFKVDPNGKETVLYAFPGGSDGMYPYGGVIMDKSGNFYGTTYWGGDSSCGGYGGYGCGVVFKLTP